MRSENLAALLNGVKPNSNGGGFLALCPAHDDRDPSLSFKDGDRGIVLTCFAGCELDKILSALNIKTPDLFFDQSTNGRRERQIAETYDYTDESGTLLFQTVRFVPKDFLQRRPDGAGGWLWNLKDTRRVLYRLPEVVRASCVLVVEGEKDVEQAYSLGLPHDWAATTSAMGAGKWRREHADALAGKWVVILPDSDEPGRKHAKQIAQSLKEKAVGINRVTLPDGVKDLSEWAEGKTAEDLASLLDQAEEGSFPSSPQTTASSERVEAPVNNGVIEAEVISTTSEPVRLSNLLDEIAALILRFVNLPGPDIATLLAVWIAGTYVYERFEYYGYLALRSPTMRCGKSRLLKLLARLANGNPPVTTTPTSASIFRNKRKVLALDEVDKLRNRDHEKYGDVIAVLNAGFERSGTVERVDKVKGSFEVRAFSVYGPKLLAGIEGLTDTLSDRAFMIGMQRTSGRMPRLSYRKLNRDLEQLRQRLAGWAAMFIDNVNETYDNLPDELSQLREFDDRFQDLAEPLLVIASLADDEERPADEPILPRLLRALQTVAGRRERGNREEQLLAVLTIVEARLGLADEVFIESTELIEDCKKHEQLAWIDESTRKLAGLLKPFDLFPKSTGNVRGYAVRREWVEKWRAQYGEMPS